MRIKIKICGMKFPENISEIAALKPDYMGFIFYGKSKRYFEKEIPDIDKTIQKIGVFVNASLLEIKEKIKLHQLDLVQLHGNETPEFCALAHQNNIKVIKAFNVDKEFNFSILKKYQSNCEYFLFDTKGTNYGGNGIAFDWSLLERYHLEKQYFLSGGIGLENREDVNVFLSKPYAEKCIAIDCNSKLESSPGIKSADKTRELINAFK